MGWGEGIGGKKNGAQTFFPVVLQEVVSVEITGSGGMTRQCSSGSESHGETKRDDDDETTDRAKTKKNGG
jgi:hypothetical protein